MLSIQLSCASNLASPRERKDNRSVNDALAEAQSKLIERLSISERRYSDLVSNLRDTVFQIDLNFRWLYINAAWESMSGYTLNSTKGDLFSTHVHAEDAIECELIFKKLLDGRQQMLTRRIRFITASGSILILDLFCRAYKDDVGNYAGISGTLSDITERIGAENRIKHLAYHDALTGLANRRLLHEHIKDSFAQDISLERTSALIYIDLDGFKRINDSFGHKVGDLLLCAVANRLRGSLELVNCLLSRVGGDEYVLLVEQHSRDVKQTTIFIKILVEKLRLSISETYDISSFKLNVTASFGVVFLDKNIMNDDDVLSLADAAMYRSKVEGKNTVRFYDKQFALAEKKARAFENALYQAYLNSEFELYYQPQVTVDGDRLVKVEALIRWHHPVEGLIGPDNFVSNLEDMGLIREVGSWVLEQACRQISLWQQSKLCDLRVSVNVSALQFQLKDFVEQIQGLIKRFDIPPRLLEIELTESVAVSDMQDSIGKMKKLNRLGVEIALDDFGTGYSSLAYLKNMPVQTIKIDKSFIDGVPCDGYDSAIVETTMLMANHLGLTVVAEGVEKKSQLKFLAHHHCQLYQGYLYSKPTTSAVLEKLFLSKLNTPI